jgi:hypothetical protein
LLADLNRRLIGWVNYCYLGPVSKAYGAVEMHSRRRLPSGCAPSTKFLGMARDGISMSPCLLHILVTPALRQQARPRQPVLHQAPWASSRSPPCIHWGRRANMRRKISLSTVFAAARSKQEQVGKLACCQPWHSPAVIHPPECKASVTI